MRQREPYTTEKQNALDWINETLEYMDRVPMTATEERIYTDNVKRLAIRYGLVRDLRQRGYDVNAHRVTKSKK